jgi:hypothetical protein
VPFVEVQDLSASVIDDGFEDVNHNSHIKRLKNTLNMAVDILIHEAKKELSEWWAEGRNSDYRNLIVLADAYDRKNEKFEALLAAIDTQVNNCLVQPENLDHWIQLETLRLRLTETVRLPENGVILNLCSKNHEIRAEIQTLHQKIHQDAVRLGGQISRLESLLHKNQEQLRLNEVARTELLDGNHRLLADNSHLRQLQEEGVINYNSQQLTSRNQTSSSSPASDSDSQSNIAFVISCMSSPTAFKIYGAVLIIAGLMITGLVSMGAIPLTLSTAGLASSLIIGGSLACFFKPSTRGREVAHCIDIDSLPVSELSLQVIKQGTIDS